MNFKNLKDKIIKEHKLDSTETTALQNFLDKYDEEIQSFLFNCIEKGHLCVWGKINPIIKIEWSLGGTAGNCWDDSLSEIESDSEPEFTVLDEILEEFWPDIKYLQYKKLIKNICESGTKSDGDYYGGNTTIAYRKINLIDLYQYIQDNK